MKKIAKLPQYKRRIASLQRENELLEKKNKRIMEFYDELVNDTSLIPICCNCGGIDTLFKKALHKRLRKLNRIEI